MDVNDGTNPVDDDDLDVDVDTGVEDENLDEPQLDADGNPIEDADADEDDELEEVEHDGKKFKLPKALKPALMFQADYTRKTQEVAEIRRNLEAAVAKQTEIDETVLTSRAKVVSIDAQLAEYGKVDWETWDRTDPQASNAAWRAYERLKDAKGIAEADLAKTVKERDVEAQRHRATQLDEARATLAKEIPGWGPELATKLQEYGTTVGFSRAELAEVTDPRAIKLLHLAMIGAEAKKTKAATQTLQQQQKTKPAPAVGGRSAPATGLSDRLTPEEWARRRNEQLSKRG